MVTIPYRTKDLNEAAFIWCQPNVRLVAVTPEMGKGTNNRRPETFFFEFELPITDEHLRKLMFAYANQETSVEPQTFVRKQGNLRDRLFSVKRKYVS